MSDSDDKGKLEVSVRILGNELVALRMDVDDFKMKWLFVGIVAMLAVGWAASSFGPELIGMFGE